MLTLGENPTPTPILDAIKGYIDIPSSGPSLEVNQSMTLRILPLTESLLRRLIEYADQGTLTGEVIENALQEIPNTKKFDGQKTALLQYLADNCPNEFRRAIS